jgi:hypothetical protein
MKSVEPVVRILETIGAPYALIGGHAVGARGFPRMTVDVDFLTTDRRVLQRDIWKSLEAGGASVDPRKGDFDDPLAGVVHIRLAAGDEVDVVVAKWKWEAGVIARAERLDVGGVNVPVPRTSDLILLKLSAGGALDLQDVVVLLAVADRERVIREVEENISNLGADGIDAWSRIAAASK